jgi:ABC-2 type transport system permease protein
MRISNPVLKREVVERWRSRRAPMTLTIYLAVLGGIMYGLYRTGIAVLRSQFGFGFDPSTAGPALGRFLVEGLFFFVLLLVLFVGPGYAAAQISGERERRTLTLLQVTLLRPVSIVLGKLGAAVAWLSLLVVAAVPLGAVAFFLGGIGIADLLRGGLMLTVLAVSVAGIGLGISSLTKKTTGSIVLTYGMVLTLTLGTLFLAGVEAILRSTRGQDVTTPIALYLNPFFGLADAVNAARPSDFGMGALPSPLGLLAEALPDAPMMGGGVAGMDGGVVRADVGMAVEEQAFAEIAAEAVEEGVAVQAQPAPPPPPLDAPVAPPVIIDDQPLPDVAPQPQRGSQSVWLIVMALYLLLGGLGVLVATRRLGVTEPRSRGGGPLPPPGAGMPLPMPAGPPGAPGVPPPPGWEAGR